MSHLQVMVDQIQSLRRDRIRRSIGVLRATQLAKVDEALRLWLGLDT